MNSSTLAPLLNLQTSDSTYRSKSTSNPSTSTRNDRVDAKNHSGISYPDHEQHSSSQHQHQHHQHLTSSPSSSTSSDSSSSGLDHDIDSTDNDHKSPSRESHPWPFSTSVTLLSDHADHTLSDHPSHSRSSLKHPIPLLNQSQTMNSPEQLYQYDQQQSSYHSYRPEWTSLPILEETSPEPHQPPYKRTRTSLSPSQSSSIKLPKSQFQTAPKDESPNLYFSYHDHHSPSKTKEDLHLSGFESLCSPHSEADQRALNARPLKNTKMRLIERAAQNRAAQRAFRERKDRYVRDLETRSAQFDAYVSRHNQLEERERNLAAREAKLQSRSPSKDPIRRQTMPDQTPHDPKDDERERMLHLQNELDVARREIHSLRSRLSTDSNVKTSNSNPPCPESHSVNQAERRHSTPSIFTHSIQSEHPSSFLSSHDTPTLRPINPPFLRRYPHSSSFKS
ncbi:uncharacterized protein MELLADRAFT_67117 [Melampsora larici-populina 98AG31]|uniref:BZIP domain-containing protein n=1 Tax=Melampsora larici-populina (strain 98AG31 / pathotype 3-4-7) TaxID=747676 RepID=F4S1V1_MELLP|nr:uncharacterized protein MELLADRAFT_67117 [Melampsora larici-populina 98AG31]EGG01444.1 hypothetical protein MELLADRAFT_67117 [Melampsora larici-populina 98AG31]